MKVRIKGNFIRYRLTKSEVDILSERGRIEEETHIAQHQVFTYALQARENIDSLKADFTEGNLTLFIPAEDAKKWNTINKVGYRATVSVDPENILVLLIEKDFQCLDDTEEDQSDNFPNPQADLLRG